MQRNLVNEKIYSNLQNTVNISLLKSDYKLSEGQNTIPCLFSASVVTIINIIGFQMKVLVFYRNSLEN